VSSAVLIVLYMLTISIIMINLFIALMSNSYGEVTGDAERQFWHERAQLIAAVGTNTDTFGVRWFRKLLGAQHACFPEVLHVIVASKADEAPDNCRH